MSYNILYDPALNIVRIKLETALDAPLAETVCLKALDLARNHKCRALLCDFRNTVIAKATMGIYGLATSLPNLGVYPDVKLAAVTSAENPDHRFFETVAKNRGSNVRSFTDVTEAERWLAGEELPSVGGQSKLEEASL